MYNTLSATTNPTVTNRFVAGRKENTIKDNDNRIRLLSIPCNKNKYQ